MQVRSDDLKALIYLSQYFRLREKGRQRNGRFFHLWNPQKVVAEEAVGQGIVRKSRCRRRVVHEQVQLGIVSWRSSWEFSMNQFNPELSLVVHLGGHFAQQIATTKARIRRIWSHRPSASEGTVQQLCSPSTIGADAELSIGDLVLDLSLVAHLGGHTCSQAVKV